MSKPKHIWLPAYLYYGEPWEEFLIGGVQPFVQTVLESERVEQFFFIRYWERGPHIRLRFKGERDHLEREVKPRLESHFNKYFKENPSRRDEPEQVSQLPKDRQWYPNNSVQFIPYEPEIDRYGGPGGILIAEKQFQYSSEAVLAAVAASKEWDYERALGAAIQLHLAFAFALDMELTETCAFFAHIGSIWFARAYGYDGSMAKEEAQRRKDYTRKAFEDTFAKQKAMLIPYHDTLWNALLNNVEFEQEWLNRWIKNMTAIAGQLRRAQDRGKLVTPSRLEHGSQDDIPLERRQLWAIYESYVHMTNNRLGILNRDEAYLGYLIKESLAGIKSETQGPQAP